MPRAPLPPYECPTCGYSTPDKSNMKKHFYKKVKPCPKTKENMTLTDEIKEHVLENRIYIKPPPPPPITINKIKNTITNYNQINNFIANMKPLEKLNHILSYNKCELIDFEDKVDAKLAARAHHLENDTYDDCSLDISDLLEIVNDMCKFNDSSCNDFNIMYDTVMQNVKIMEGGTWESMLRDKGVKRVVEIIKGVYLDKYESYLIRQHLGRRSERAKQGCFQQLELYYSFIGSFDIPPLAKEEAEDDERYERYAELYNKVTNKLTKSHVNKIKNEVQDILKRNTKRNIEELNLRMLDLLRVDNEFRDLILPQPHFAYRQNSAGGLPSSDAD